MAESKIPTFVIPTESAALDITNVHSNISLHASYREATIWGKVVIAYIVFTVNNTIPAWDTLFTISNSNLVPSRLQRVSIGTTDQLYIEPNGTTSKICAQTNMTAGLRYAVFCYIRK